MSLRNSVEAFISKSNIVHNDRYDYSLVAYVNTHTKVEIVCALHGSFFQQPVNHMRGQGCPVCKTAKIKTTKRDRHGSENYNNIKKQKQTMVDRYGVEYALQNEHIQTKFKQTMVDRYGVEYSGLSDLLIQKKTQTTVDRYGVEVFTNRDKAKQTSMNVHSVDHHWKDPETREKITKTMLERYGVKYPGLSFHILKKVEQTNLKQYGVKYPLQHTSIWNQTQKTQDKHYGGVLNGSSVLKEKIKQTNILRYNVEYARQRLLSHILPLLQDHKWLVDQYITQNKTATQIANELGVDDTTVGNYLRKHEIDIKQSYFYSYKCIQWLEFVMKQEQIHIQHALRGGEYQIPGTRYRVDGYCKDTNTVYEFHGNYWHGNPNIYDQTVFNEITNCTMGELYQKTMVREQTIKEKGYNLVVIWESDWTEEV